ncbi:MAG: hypothetical protein ABI183_27425 [Polyangiaceae bacterium]
MNPRTRTVLPGRLRVARLVLSFALVATCSRAARADDATDSARAHFSEGVTRFEAGDYEGARALFLRADSEHHAPVIIYNVARSEERLDHPQAAVDAYDSYLREAGDSGEFATAAALAMAQIRARSPRLRVETSPPGANVFVDAQAAPEKSPTSILVTIGHHHVVAQGDDWHAETEVDATDPSKGAIVTLARAPGNSAVSSTSTPTSTHLAPAPETVPISGPNGLVLGMSFSIVAYHFFSKRGQADTTTGVAPALIADVGYAITPRVEITLRVLGGLGSEGTPVTLVEGLGPGFSFRALPALWIGAWCLGGRIESSFTPGEPIPGEAPGPRYVETGWVFAPELEASVALFQTDYGQWMLSISPSYYFASPQDNGALFVPMSFGLRTF